MSLLSQVKLFHWSTMSYAKHKALDHLHEELSEKVDLLFEAYIGKYRKQPLKIFVVKTIATTNTKDIEGYLEMNRNIINDMQNQFMDVNEIQNILQDIMAHIDRTVYLCKFT